MNKNVIIDITSYIRHLTKMVIKVSLAMILAVEMLSGSITGVWKGFNSTKAEAADNDTITLRMTANRVYRKKLNKDYVLGEIRRGSGTQFDPKLVDIMLRLIDSGRIDIDNLYKDGEADEDK